MNGKKYTVQDTKSGKTVTFEWNQPTDPTDADFEEVFTAAGYRTPVDSGRTGYHTTEQQTRTLDESRAYNEAQRRSMAQSSQEKEQRKFAPFVTPFSVIGESVGMPRAGAVMDAALPQVRLLAEAVKQGASVPSSPDVRTGILRGTQALGTGTMAGLSAAHPLGFAQFGATTEAASQMSPDIEEILGSLSTPVQSLTSPQTPYGQELAKSADIGIQTGISAVASQKNIRDYPRQKFADALSQSAFKIPPSIKRGERVEMLRTIQEHNIGRGTGLEKIDKRVGELKVFAEGLEKKAIDAGGAVSLREVLNSLDEVKSKWSKSDTPQDFNKIIDGYKKKVIAQNKPELGVQELIDLKRNLQGQLSGVYEKQMKINPNIRESVVKEAKAAVEVDVRKRLEEMIPGYKDVNSRIHKLLNVRPHVEQAINRIDNHDFIRWREATFGGLTYFGTENPYAAFTVMALSRVLTNPKNQATIANWVSPQKYKAPIAPPSKTISENLDRMKQLFPNWKPPSKVGVEIVPEHKSIIEQAGGRYLGTNKEGSMFFDDNAGSTGVIPKGSSLEEAIRIIKSSNKRTSQ